MSASWPTGDPRRAGLVLDFDGVLAPIVDDPEGSRLGDGLGPVLSDLAAVLGLVGVVSGRPASFLAGQVTDPRIRLVGHYGVEVVVDGAAVARAEAAEWASAVDDARAALVSALDGLAGVYLEDKGLSVAAHWRNASDRDAVGRVVSAVTSAVAEVTGLRAEPGKFVVELRPPVSWDKGSAVELLVEEFALAEVAYAGDDRGDLVAFDAVARRGGVTIAVDHGAETPPELLAAAAVVVRGSEGFAAWLVALRDRLVAPPRG